MTPAEQIFDYRFPNVDCATAILTLSRPLAELAASHGWTLETWQEGGLGDASGVFLRLGSGHTVLLMELRHEIEHFGATGPTAFVDGAVLATHGLADLLAEVLATLGLTEHDVSWIATAGSQQSAIDFVNDMRNLPPPPSVGPPDSYMHTVNPREDDIELECYGELDRDRYPIRWIRKYSDGRFETCSYAQANWRDMMPEGVIPTVSEINDLSGFSAHAISASEFEATWRLALGFK
ncbi:hypothetical protein BRADO5234 [Bradyrhizobium sp. ORS 278]|uniref:DUF6881 domain-containing protein n=1 Tax=Bradyrhizobium sp. (strain ORS 278) TaxID=114615 RepID=UPI0001508BC8|nr:hypothetical protein [Bradyrhizobium sp. ORS 278]CAL78922.1 hypothetical protein BRADO5234 [Bradyrhizobium sp. ORS 278]